MGSSRLPGKTMAHLYRDMTLLECVIRRFQACKTLDLVVIATSVEKVDDVIAEWCLEKNIPVFRGSEENVLERVLGAANLFKAESIVQMGADSAYLDYDLIDRLVSMYHSHDCDYVCNDLKLTYPLGIYGHVVKVEKLAEIAIRNDLKESDRSDVVRYIWEHPEQYSIINVEALPGQYDPSLRLTIDYPEDLEQARRVYEHFGCWLFTTDQILELCRTNPLLFEQTRSLRQASAPFLKIK